MFVFVLLKGLLYWCYVDCMVSYPTIAIWLPICYS